MRILILGGAGYLGSVLINKLITLSNESIYSEKKSGAVTGFDEMCHYVNADKITVIDNLMYHRTTLTEHCYMSNFQFIYGFDRKQKLLRE